MRRPRSRVGTHVPPCPRVLPGGPLALGALALAGLAGCGGGEPAPTTSGDAPSSRAAGGGWLVEVTDELGVDFVHEPGAAGNLQLPEIGGGGAALLDYDGDGDLDLYLVNGGPDVEDQRRKDGAPNRLFRNDGARMSDVTAQSGTAGTAYGMGCAVADVDNDGRLDIYVSNYGPDELLRNADGARFERMGREEGVEVPGWSSSVGFLDMDRDGDLDVYVTRYVRFLPGKQCFSQADQRDYCGPRSFPPVSDVLLRNEGGRSFTDVSEAAGITSVEAAGLGVTCDDFDEDGWIDVYVANDAYANNLWTNQRDGTFVDDALLLGAALNMEGKWEAGMGVVSADFDNDGLIDLYVTHLFREKNTLYRNLGGGMGFVDASGEANLTTSSLSFTGFGVDALDLEMDGDLDLLVVNGRVERGELDPRARQEEPWNWYAEPNLLYLNRGDGGFDERTELAPEFCDTVEISRGLALGDLDGDGDLDAVVTNTNGRARVYRNDAPREGAWLRVEARDPALSRVAHGARLRLRVGDRAWVRTVGAGSSYQCAGDLRVQFTVPSALEDGLAEARLDVRWPDGRREEYGVERWNAVQVVERGRGKELP